MRSALASSRHPFVSNWNDLALWSRFVFVGANCRASFLHATDPFAENGITGGMGVRVTRFVTPIDTFERIQGPMEKFLSLTHTQCEKCLLKVFRSINKLNLFSAF
jgi:hypothetical protein